MADAAEFSTEDLLPQAQGNATAFVLATIAYLKEHGLEVDDYVAFFGRQFAPGWEEMRDQPILEVARSAATNAVSIGGELRSLSGDDTHAEALLAGWPDEDISSTLGLAHHEGDAMWNSFVPIMERLNIRYAWQREGDAVRITFER